MSYKQGPSLGCLRKAPKTEDLDRIPGKLQPLEGVLKTEQ